MIATDRDGAALLAGIIACPGDNALRLVYADWLEDNGQHERSEWIRASVMGHAGALPALVKDDPFPKLGLADVSNLYLEVVSGAGAGQAIPYQWSRGVDFAGHPEFRDHGRNMAYTIDRGFIKSVRCGVKAWVKYGPAVASIHPIESVSVTDKSPYVDSAMRARWFFVPYEIVDPLFLDSNDGGHWLPLALMAHAEGVEEGDKGESCAHWRFADASLATIGLSRCLIKWARSSSED